VVDGNDYDDDYDEGSGHDKTTTTTTMADTVGGMATTG
jgi:hypothetical protein